MRKWTEVGFSSIYYVLEKLELKGLATSTDAQGNEKKQYSITDTGVCRH
jgi:DNA-binding PadR family transcriptional regulator